MPDTPLKYEGDDISTIGFKYADYIVDGIADEVQIRDAITDYQARSSSNTLGSVANIKMMQGIFNIASAVVVTSRRYLNLSGMNSCSRIKLINSQFIELIDSHFCHIKDVAIYGTVTSSLELDRYSKDTIDKTVHIAHANNSDILDNSTGEVALILSGNKHEVSNIHFEDNDVAILVKQGYENKISNVMINSSKYGIVAVQTNPENADVGFMYIDKVYFEPVAKTDVAMYFDRFAGTITNCEIVGSNTNNYGIYIRDCYGGFPLIQNCAIESVIDCIRLELYETNPFNNGGYISQVSIDNCYLMSTGGSAIKAIGSSANLQRLGFLSITNNRRLSNTGNADVIHIKNVEGIIITGNKFNGVETSANTVSSIHLENCKNVVITSNSFVTPTGHHPPKYCITYDADCENIIIDNNLFNGGFVTSAINAGRSGSDIIIGNNI